jgi:hypothetical protein
VAQGTYTMRYRKWLGRDSLPKMWHVCSTVHPTYTVITWTPLLLRVHTPFRVLSCMHPYPRCMLRRIPCSPLFHDSGHIVFLIKYFIMCLSFTLSDGMILSSSSQSCTGLPSFTCPPHPRRDVISHGRRCKETDSTQLKMYVYMYLNIHGSRCCILVSHRRCLRTLLTCRK